MESLSMTMSDVRLILSVGIFLVEGWAFADALSRSAEVFVAAGKLNKAAWLVILGLALAGHLLLPNSPFHFLNLAGGVAAAVYMVDARPGLRGLTRH